MSHCQASSKCVPSVGLQLRLAGFMPPRLHLQNVKRSPEDTDSPHADSGTVSTKRRKWNSNSYWPSRLLQHTPRPKADPELVTVIEHA